MHRKYVHWHWFSLQAKADLDLENAFKLIDTQKAILKRLVIALYEVK